VYVCAWFYLFIDSSTFFSTFPYVYDHLHLPFHLNIFFALGDQSLSIVSLTTPPFQKVCGNCHVANVTISLTGGVYCNACHSKSKVQNFGFFHGSIATNDEPMLLTIEGKWLETIMHMTETEFLDLPPPKQVQLLISIHTHGNFAC
jgi:hypothetical protein